jgi:hypothetical protein
MARRGEMVGHLGGVVDDPAGVRVRRAYNGDAHAVTLPAIAR